MTHTFLKSCLKIHTSHNSLVNYASCVYSVFFVDLAQLITVLAIAKSLSPNLHDLPTTTKHTRPPHPLLSESAPPLVSWALLRIPDNRTSARSSCNKWKGTMPTKRKKPLRPDEKSPRSGLLPSKARPDEKSPSKSKKRSPTKSLTKGNTSKSKQRAPAKSANSKKGSTNFSDRRGILAVFKLRRVQDNR
jgi:hypothetical protein